MQEITLGQKYPDSVIESHVCNPINGLAYCEECGILMKPIILTNGDFFRGRLLDENCCDYYECECGFKADWVKGASKIIEGR